MDSKIGSIKILDVKNSRLIPTDNLWQNNPCVIIFLRRFGCLLCRAVCVKMSKIKNVLDKHGIKLIAIGFDLKGYKAFEKGQYFQGDVYIDEHQECYEALSLRKQDKLSGMLELLSPALRRQAEEAKALGLTESDFQGDGFRLGGTYIVDKGGRIIFEERQSKVTDHISPEQVVTLLEGEGLIGSRLSYKSRGSKSDKEDETVCDETECHTPPTDTDGPSPLTSLDVDMMLYRGDHDTGLALDGGLAAKGDSFLSDIAGLATLDEFALPPSDDLDLSRLGIRMDEFTVSEEEIGDMLSGLMSSRPARPGQTLHSSKEGSMPLGIRINV